MKFIALKKKGFFHVKYILITHLSLLTCTLLSHVNNPQFYPTYDLFKVLGFSPLYT
jgi:hypothetical protein